MKLVDITSENWEDVIFLTTNETNEIDPDALTQPVNGIFLAPRVV